MRRVLWVAALLVTTAGLPHAAHASTYLHCDDGFHQLRGKAGSNPPVSATVARQDDGRWSVVYVLSNGQTVMRENQYDIADKGDGVGWTGWRSGKQMRASIEHYNGRLIYAEAVYAGGEKLVGSNYIDCGPAPADEPDYTPAQTPAQAYVATPPAQAYVAATPAPTYAPALDRLPVMISHNQAHAAVSLGTLPVIMLIDTGCTNMSVSQSIAERLLTSGQAMRGEDVEATLADGSTHTEASIVINSMTVGGHVLSDVPASVSPNGAEMLLGFNVLNRVSGKFAINVANSTLDFE